MSVKREKQYIITTEQLAKDAVTDILGTSPDSIASWLAGYWNVAARLHPELKDKKIEFMRMVIGEMNARKQRKKKRIGL